MTSEGTEWILRRHTQMIKSQNTREEINPSSIKPITYVFTLIVSLREFIFTVINTSWAMTYSLLGKKTLTIERFNNCDLIHKT